MKTKEEIFNKLSQLISELFEVPFDKIKLESKFYEDLDLDSIDAIDLIGQVQSLLGQRLDPEEFKSVRTVEDVVNVAYRILENKEKSA